MLESWCGDYCLLLVVLMFIILISVLLLSTYLTKTGRLPAGLVCLTTKRRRRSGMSVEYAFATTTPPTVSGSLTGVEYRTTTTTETSGATSTTPSDWYQQQLTALLQVSSGQNFTFLIRYGVWLLCLKRIPLLGLSV